MKGGNPDWLGHHLPKKEYIEIDDDELEAEKQKDLSNKLARVELGRDMLDNYINRSMSIDEFKDKFRPEGNLGADSTILFTLLKEHKSDIKRGSWNSCIDSLNIYKETIRLLKDEYVSPPSSPTSEPRSAKGQLRRKKKKTRRKKRSKKPKKKKGKH